MSAESMTPEQVRANLTAEEWKRYRLMQLEDTPAWEQDIKTYESLAACREVLKKHEWSPDLRCKECWNRKAETHKPDCALAEIVKGEEE